MLTVEPALVEKYVRPGTLKLVFRDVLNHGERSIRASEAAACVGKQGQFWEIHGLLFERQPDLWATGDAKQVELLSSYVQELKGLDQKAFATCMADRVTLKTLQAADQEQRKRGITSQPIFEIGSRRLVGVQSVEVMSTFIDEGLK
ncbi:MAG: hypothetical protein EXR62_09625 [Chloroflexi bacterium]|nr:hypothetical protein [Chloroflexota bacterium]